MIDIKTAIEKYGACEHGIMPYDTPDPISRNNPCILCKRESTLLALRKRFLSGKTQADVAKRRMHIWNAGGNFTPEEWLERFDYWGKCCVLCNIELTLQKKHSNTATVGHLIPVSEKWPNSSNEAWNIAPMCKSCNSSQGDRYALEEYPKGSKILRKFYKHSI